MTKMSTIYSRLSYGTGTALTGCGVSAKAYADVTKTEVWVLADKVAGMTLSDWAIIIGIACMVTTTTKSQTLNALAATATALVSLTSLIRANFRKYPDSLTPA